MPRVVKIIGSVGEKIVKTVTIIPEKKYPLKITDVTAKKGKDIKFNLTQIKEPDKKGYLLTVENLKKDHGRFYDTISLKTNSELKPEIIIRIYGNIIDKKQKGDI